MLNEDGDLRGSARALRFAPTERVAWVGYARVARKDRALTVVRIPDEGPPLVIRREPLSRLQLDRTEPPLFEAIRALPTVFRAGRSIF